MCVYLLKIENYISECTVREELAKKLSQAQFIKTDESIKDNLGRKRKIEAIL